MNTSSSSKESVSNEAKMASISPSILSSNSSHFSRKLVMEFGSPVGYENVSDSEWAWSTAYSSKDWLLAYYY